jgi:hypothetical protein
LDDPFLQGEVEKARGWAFGGIIIGSILTLAAIGVLVWFLVGRN